MTSFNTTSLGTSPGFPITAEDFVLRWRTAVTRISIDGVHPPILGAEGGSTVAMKLINRWSPWIDEKLIEPKFDGIGQHLAVVSNRPTFIKDFHVLSIMRAVDHVLKPTYVGFIEVTVTTVNPISPQVTE